VPAVVYQVIYSILAVAAAWFVKNFVSDRLIGNFTTKLELGDHESKPIKKFFAVIIYIIAIFVLLRIWHLRGTLTGLLAGAGIVGIVIGLAIRDIISDVLAGIILFFDRPFKIGDSLVMGDVGGKVLDIGLRSVKLKTWDGVFATIPNRKVCSEVLKNYTKYNQRRLEVVVGVDYDSDLQKAQEAITKALNREDLPILKDPEPIVALETLDASSINFKVLFWFSTDAGIPWITLRGKLMQVIVEEFRKEKISIPFPQVTISPREGSEPPKIA
jgi:small conductance mechanosensitive channel